MDSHLPTLRVACSSGCDSLPSSQAPLLRLIVPLFLQYNRPLTLVKDTIQTRNRKSSGKVTKKSKSKKNSHLSLPPILSPSISIGNGATPTGDGRRFILPQPSSVSQYDTRFDLVGYAAPAFSQPNSFPLLPPYLPREGEPPDMKPNKHFVFSSSDNKTSLQHIHGNGVEDGGMVGINPSQFSAFSPFPSEPGSGSSPLHPSPHHTQQPQVIM